MTRRFIAPNLSSALAQFKKIVACYAEKGGGSGKRLVVFCEDRLSLVAERAVCEEAGGTFCISVYTLSRFLSAEGVHADKVLSSQGSAMAISRLIQKNSDKLKLFGKLSKSGAAQSVYDTIALLYSSRVSADDIAAVDTGSALLSRKLHDLAILYRGYSDYLKETGAEDRNAYLRKLPAVIARSERIRGASVLFLGFQAFTATAEEAVKACVNSADNVYGIFIGGAEKKYVNEASASFEKIANECKKSVRVGADGDMVKSNLAPVAEFLRRNIFEPESLYRAVPTPIEGGTVRIVECADEDEECELFAAACLKCVKEGGIRYRDISVMLPDLNAYQPALERAFEEYKVPYYVDRRYPLSSHPICEFIVNYLVCAADGCRQESVLSAVSSPLFAFDSESMNGDKDSFVNYMLRAVGGRGGVNREINAVICSDEGINADGAARVREKFIKGLKFLPKGAAAGEAFADGIRALLKEFSAEETLERLAVEAEEAGFASVAAMSRRAYTEVLSVVDECERLTLNEKYAPRDFLRILKSGFTAALVSLIPPKQDAVFVGDLYKCVNAGAKVLMAGGLKGDVPLSSADTAVLTDAELNSLEKLKISVAPKIAQVNLRARETVALNICAFSNSLLLTYPVRFGGEEVGKSEIISYVKRLYSIGGANIAEESFKQLMFDDGYFAYFNCRRQPAQRHVLQYKEKADKKCAAMINALKYALEKEGAYPSADRRVSGGGDLGRLYGGFVSPTGLETYFACPYKVFIERGLRLAERREGAFRPLDSGNFIHEVLQETAKRSAEFASEDDCAAFAKNYAEQLVKSPAYAFSSGGAESDYTVRSLTEEAAVLSVAAYRQIKGSAFIVSATEKSCSLRLFAGAFVGGRIDRVDECGDLVRVIDYKTGSVDDKAESYYMGLKLQLPLYLSAAAEGKRPIGAYYFPANIDYAPDKPNAFTLRGFMDGEESVIQSSDCNLENGETSKLVGAALGKKNGDRVMERETFENFLNYGKIVAAEGGRAMLAGEISPSPAEGACEYCAFKGCCGYDAEADGERKRIKASCAEIAEIAKKAEGAKNGG